VNIVNAITPEQLQYWADDRGEIHVFRAPDDVPGCSDCNAVVTPMPDGQTVVRVAWKPSDDDIMQLLAGGTIWLSTWGGLPPHMLEVQAPS